VAVAVLAHRLVLMTDAKFAGVTTQSVVEDLLASVPVPA
jgi:hypothetical protein